MNKHLLLFLLLCSVSAGAQMKQPPPCKVLYPPPTARFALMNLPFVAGQMSAHVSIDFDCDSILTHDKGANLEKYVRDTLFKQVKKWFGIDSINVDYHSTHGWLTTDPETAAGITSSAMWLSSFRDRMIVSHPASDYHVYLSGSGVNMGGSAYLGTLGTNYNVAFCNLHTYDHDELDSVYDWNVECVAHEIAHGFFASHTHGCCWNGNNTAIDSLPGYTEGGCIVGGGNIAIPTIGGTIESYGHITQYGIKFYLGWGEQPRDTMRGFIQTANIAGKLLYPNGYNPCSPPSVTSISPDTLSCYVSWTANSFKYRYRYRKIGQIWNAAIPRTTNSATITGLSSKTSYSVQVRAYCNGAFGNWGVLKTFKTK